MLRRILKLYLIIQSIVFSLFCSVTLASELKCDSVSYFVDSFDKHSNQSFDSAIFYIDRAIDVSHGCALFDKEVRFILEKAQFLASQGEVQESQKVIKNAQDRAFQIGDSSLISKSYLNYGIILTDISDFDRAIKMFDQALLFLLTTADSLDLSIILTNRGIAFDRKGIYEKALADYLEALKMEIYRKDTSAIGQLYNNIAIVYKRQEDLGSAKKYYYKALEIATRNKDDFAIAITNVNLGLLEKDLNNFKSSEALFNASLEQFKKENHTYGIAAVLHNIGELKYKENLPKKAVAYYKSSQDYAEKNDFRQLVAKNNLSLAQIYFDLKLENTALDYALKSLEIAQKYHLIEEQCNAYKLLSGIYELKKQPENALYTYKMYHTLEDSLFNLDKTAVINQLKNKYESTEKDIKIEMLMQEQAMNETELIASDRQRKILMVLSFSMLLIFALFVFLFVKIHKYNKKLNYQKEKINRQKLNIESKQVELISKNRALEKLSKEKDDLINIVAHDLRSPLNHVKGLVTILKNELDVNNHENVENYFEKIDQSIQTLSERINKILNVELINNNEFQMKLEPIAPGKLLKQIEADFELEAARKNIKILNRCNGFSTYLKADYNYSLQVVENLVSNAIKFSNPGKPVLLDVSETANHVRLHVKDKGPGLSKEDQKKLFTKFTRLSTKPTGNEKSIGLGLVIVKKFVEKMNGKVWCESEKGKGCEFIVEFQKA